MVWRGTRIKFAAFTTRFTIQNGFDQVFGHLLLKIWDAANWQKCVEMANNFCIGIFSSCYTIFEI
jgi:hypothetical protein